MGMRDLRSALRSIRHAPGTMAIAIACLALGIGASTALFTVLDRVVLEPLPFHEPDRLVTLRETHTSRGIADLPASTESFERWRAHARSFTSIVGWKLRMFTVGGTDLPERIIGGQISDGFFETLGVWPALGRTFVRGEQVRGGPPVVIISHRFWQRHFDGDRTVLGRTIQLNRQLAVIVGVMPPDAIDPDTTETDCWVPFWFDEPMPPRRDIQSVRVVARLVPGMTLASAQHEMDGVAARLAADMPRESRVDPTRIGILVASLQDDVIGPWRQPLFALFGAIACVLALACLNTSMLLLSRVLTRRSEFAVRLAIGASHAALFRLVLVETAVIAGIAAIAGFAGAAWTLDVLVGIMGRFMPRLTTAHLDVTALAFTIAAAAISVIVASAGPLLHLWRLAAPLSLRDHAATMTANRRGRAFLRTIVIVEIALALTLTLAAVLTVSDLVSRWPWQPGFDWRGKLAIRVTLAGPAYEDAAHRIATVEAIVDRLRSIPSVQAVAQASLVPYDQYLLTTYVARPSQPTPGLSDRPATTYATVSPNFFDTMRMRIVEGRTFTPAENRSAPTVFVITEGLRARLFPNRPAIGQSLTVNVFNPTGSLRGDTTRTGTIVGVVAATEQNLNANRPTLIVYAPFAQHAMRFATFIVASRSHTGVGSLPREVRAALRDVDPTLVADYVRTLEELVGLHLQTSRFFAATLGIAGVIGLTLAVAGVYAILVWFLSQRVHEIGLRLALGASPRHIRNLVVRDGVSVIASGLMLGAVACYGARSLVGSLLVGVTWDHPFRVGAAAGALVAIVALAAILPIASRASAIDITRLLRRV